MPPDVERRLGPAYKRARANILRMIADTGVAQKEVAFAADMSESVFSQKLRGVRSHFYLDEMNEIAEWFRRKTGRPLVGFPYIEWTLMEAIDRRLFGWHP